MPLVAALTVIAFPFLVPIVAVPFILLFLYVVWLIWSVL